MVKMNVIKFFFIFFIISYFACSYAEVYKCETIQGKISYQASPCKENKGESLKLQENNSKKNDTDKIINDTNKLLNDTNKLLEELKNAAPIEFKPVKTSIDEMRNLFEKSKPNIAYNLKDPTSVMYRGVKGIKVEYFNKQYIYFCGEVNAKNSYGGYTGYQPFFSDGSDLQIGNEHFTAWKKINGTEYKFTSVTNYCFVSGEDLQSP